MRINNCVLLLVTILCVLTVIDQSVASRRSVRIKIPKSLKRKHKNKSQQNECVPPEQQAIVENQQCLDLSADVCNGATQIAKCDKFKFRVVHTCLQGQVCWENVWGVPQCTPRNEANC
ncbi:hypothetical protein BKA69DRAFT_1049873 [Paraphysoderma sedebokerense]|nr:hypothetical protein BKA69DRAFT_1049873 [Paraphysoderma sedebokerense]